MTTLREIGEIETLVRLARARGVEPGDAKRPAPREALEEAPGVILGSGDDAAVVRASPDCDLVVTTDGFVEGRHYDSDLFSPREVGARLAIANLSDLAAMAARPRWALLSLGVRPEHNVDALVALQEGLLSVLESNGATVVGGNIAAVGSEEWASLTLLGEVARGRAWTRSGAKPGDLIVVTGNPGRAAAAFRVWQRFGAEAAAPAWRALLDAWVRPEPRTRFAQALASAAVVSAAIDLSDGFAGNLVQLCRASGVGADVEEARWGHDALIVKAAEALSLGPTSLRYGPSDDYELLLAVPAAKHAECERIARELGVPISIAGRFTGAAGTVVRVVRSGERIALEGSGFDHFGG